MTKEDLRKAFHQGFALADVLDLVPGQDCMIFKAEKFSADDQVIYIPDIDLNEIPYSVDLSEDNSLRDASNGKWESMTANEQIDLVLSYCYTGDDFVDLCEDDEALAYRLFCYCDWQHPSSALPECEYDDEEDKKWAEETYASLVSTKDCTT